MISSGTNGDQDGSRIARRKMDNTSPPSLVDLVSMRKWQKAREYVEENPNSIYVTAGRNSRLVIHELCKVVTFPISPDLKREEISDDEDDDVIEQESVACTECIKEENMRIVQFVRFMIELSHQMGPVRFPAPSEQDEVEEEGDDDEEEDGVNDGPNQVPDENSPQEDVPTPSFQVHESLLTVTDLLGKTPLHVLCESSADRNMMEVILSCTRESTGHLSAPTAQSLIAAKDSNGSTPLHYLAYSRVCPYSSLVLMMDYCCPDPGQSTPDPTLATDVDGDTPIHWALDGYMSPRRIKQLIRYHKRALWVANSVGRRPFDQFVANFVDSDWYLHELCGKEVWDNIQGYLKVLSDDVEDEGSRHGAMKKEKPWLPLHALAGSTTDLPEVFLDIGLHYAHEDVAKRDDRGLLPLHIACARTSNNPRSPGDGSVATKILAANTQSAFQPAEGTGRLPLHIAVESVQPLHLVASLLKAYPSSLNIPDPVTGLHPFLLAGTSNPYDVNVAYGLIRADPSIIQAMVTRPALRRNETSINSLSSYNSDIFDDQASKMLKNRLTLTPSPSFEG